jgi:pyruvate dehydrogenase E2 component (dihydrolipoamide acetyltransferase)
MIQLSQKLNSFAKQKVSVNEMILKAAAIAALKVPAINSTWMGDFIRFYKDVNMGITI